MDSPSFHPMWPERACCHPLTTKPRPLPSPLCSESQASLCLQGSREACVHWLPEGDRPLLKKLLLSGPFSSCKRQFSLDLRVGPGSFKAFPARSLYLASAKGKGSRQGGWDVEVVAQGQNGCMPRLCRPREEAGDGACPFSSGLGCPQRSLRWKS